MYARHIRFILFVVFPSPASDQSGGGGGEELYPKVQYFIIRTKLNSTDLNEEMPYCDESQKKSFHRNA